jgi:hypothetical protein
VVVVAMVVAVVVVVVVVVALVMVMSEPPRPLPIPNVGEASRPARAMPAVKEDIAPVPAAAAKWREEAWRDDDIFIVEPDDSALSALLTPVKPTPAPPKAPDLLGPLGPIRMPSRS